MAKIVWTVNGKKLPWPPKPFPGMPSPVWELKTDFIKDFISKHNLKPARQELLIDGKAVKIIPPWWKYGGPWGPHLHVDNEIFVLDKAQWNKFADGFAREIGLKLDTARTIDFEAFNKKVVEIDLARRTQ